MTGQYNPVPVPSNRMHAWDPGRAGWGSMAFIVEGSTYCTYAYALDDATMRLLVTGDCDIDGDPVHSTKTQIYDGFGNGFVLNSALASIPIPASSEAGWPRRIGCRRAPRRRNTRRMAGRAAKGIDELKARIREADRAYYVLDSPVLSDAEYDRLMRDLLALEEAHPELATADSPTRRVSGEPSERFAKVEHREPMLSLGNVTTDEELDEFDARVHRMLDIPPDARWSTSASPSSTASPWSSSTGTASWRRARPAATGRWART